MGQKTYDVIVVGSGVGGSILAARIAEKGVNRRNGERLRVAMIEAGPYWRGAPNPGYGIPLRRQLTTNFMTDDSPDRMWPWGMVKMVGGTTMHYGGSVYLPYDVDYGDWVEEGTDWTEAACADAAAEIERVYNIHSEPDEVLTRGNLMFRSAVRSLGRSVHPALVARKNCLYCGFCEGGYFCRYDSKMNALTTYIPIAERQGVEIIPDTNVQKVIFERRGERQTAVGVACRQGGGAIEIRGEKVILAAGVSGSPMLLFRSGYGPKSELGANALVDNRNVGKHLDIHSAIVVSAYFDDPIKDGSRGAAPAGFFFLDDDGPNGHGRLRVKDSGMIGIEEPWGLAFSDFAPDFGREHKAFMKRARMHRGGILVVLKKPENYRGSINLTSGQMEYEGNSEIEKRMRHGGEIAVEVLKKMGARRISGHDMPPIYHIAHGISTCKAGVDPAESVVNPDFEVHGVENLFVSDASVLPRSASGDAVGPIAVVSVLAAQRIVRKHFTR